MVESWAIVFLLLSELGFEWNWMYLNGKCWICDWHPWIRCLLVTFSLHDAAASHETYICLAWHFSVAHGEWPETNYTGLITCLMEGDVYVLELAQGKRSHRDQRCCWAVRQCLSSVFTTGRGSRSNPLAGIHVLVLVCSKCYSAHQLILLLLSSSTKFYFYPSKKYSILHRLHISVMLHNPLDTLKHIVPKRSARIFY
jgi:hypothetical protein